MSEVRIPLTFGATKKAQPELSLFDFMARMEGFEPPTAWFVARYSIQLSYMRNFEARIFGPFDRAVNAAAP